MSEAIPSWARVGAKVVCVDDAPIPGQMGPGWGGLDGLTRGEIYTIRGHAKGSYSGLPGVLLAEIIRPLGRRESYEQPFRLSRFRPLVSQADDIATHFSQFLDTRARELV